MYRILFLELKTIAQAEKYIVEKYIAKYKEDGFGLYLVKLKEDEVPIGICGLVKRNTLPDVDVGFAFLPQFIGLGYGFESASAVVKFARNKLGLKKLLGITVPHNHNSIKLLERLGFKFEKKFRMPGDQEELMLFENDV